MEFDLNSALGPSWLEDAQRRTRNRLLSSDLSCIIGHCDWWSDSLRWVQRQLHVVHDWDSVVSLPETAISGAAAAIFPANGLLPGATLEESHAFLSAYEQARGQKWMAEELEVSWAAGLFGRAFDAKKDFLRGQADRSCRPWRAKCRSG